MANVLNRTSLQYITSVNTPEYPIAEWIINPDLSAVNGIDKEFWVVDGDTVREMSTAEKDADVANWKAKRKQELLQSLLGFGNAVIPSQLLTALRDEWLAAKIDNNVTVVNYLQPWIDFDNTLTAEYKVRRDAIDAATTYAQVFAVSVDFSSYTASIPAPVSISDARGM